MSNSSGENQQSRRTGVLVLGMHRSGTSALVRVLNLLGCDLPKTLIGANKSNESGHWESSAIARLNDRILGSAGTHWDDWLEFNPGWLSSPRRPDFEAEALETLASEFGTSPLFVLKDPRICRLAPFWLDTLRAAGVEPLIIVPLRNPLEVAASLSARNGMSTGLGQLLWLRHLLDAEASTRGQPRCFVSYDRLLGGWGSVAEKIQSSFHLSLPRLSTQAAIEIEAFLMPEQRHHKETEGALTSPMLSTWLKDSFAVFDAWANGIENVDGYPALDRIRGEFNAAAPAFAQAVAHGIAAESKARKLNKRLEALQVEFDDTRTAAAKAANEVKGLESALAAQQKLLAAARDELQTTKDELAQATVSLAAQRKALAVAEAAAAEMPRLKAEIETGTRFRSEAEAALATLRAEAVTLTAAHAALGARAAEIEAEITPLWAERTALEQQISSLQTELAARNAQHQDAEFARATLAETLRSREAAHEAELEALNHALVEATSRLGQTESALIQRRLEAEETTAELTATQAQLRDAAAARLEAEGLVAGFEEHVSALIAELRERREAHTGLEEALASAQTELAQAKLASRREREARAAVEATVAKLQDGELHLSRRAAELERDVAGYRTGERKAQLDLYALRAEHVLVVAARKLEKREAKELRATEANLTRAHAELRDAFSTLQAERAAEQKQAKALSAENTELTDALQQRQEALAQANMAFDEAAHRRGALDVEIGQLKQQLASQNADVHSLQPQIEKARSAAASEIGRTALAMLDGVRWLPAPLRLRRQIALLKRSGMLDPDWYLSHYADVASAGYDPYRHYVEHGAREGREPNGRFAMQEYEEEKT